MAYLLDLNVLISLIDSEHEHHKKAKTWFKAFSREGWATCPITQNGFLRILGNPAYPRGYSNPGEVLPILNSLLSQPGHEFWPDSISLTDTTTGLSKTRIISRSITDLYLLALASRNNGKFLTLDRRIDTNSVKGGADAFVQL